MEYATSQRRQALIKVGTEIRRLRRHQRLATVMCRRRRYVAVHVHVR